MVEAIVVVVILLIFTGFMAAGVVKWDRVDELSSSRMSTPRPCFGCAESADGVQ